jgi:phytanoyl-CoA dioxygenase PhyH
MKTLTSAAVERYQRDGFYFPIPVLTPGEAREYRRRLEAVEAAHGGTLTAEIRQKPHLLFTWLADLVRHPAILDAVEDVLGPNLLVWSTSFFIKGPRDSAFVSWHQDATYWGLSEPDVITAWVAFTEATVDNGAMRMVPGSHGEQLAHRDTFAANNLLSRGQEIEVEVDEARGVDTTCGWCTARPRTGRTTGGSGSRSATSRPTYGSWPATSMAPCSCAGLTTTTTTSPSVRRRPISRPRRAPTTRSR